MSSKRKSRGSRSAIGFTRVGSLLRLTFAGHVGALEKGLNAEMLRIFGAFARYPGQQPFVTFIRTAECKLIPMIRLTYTAVIHHRPITFALNHHFT